MTHTVYLPQIGAPTVVAQAEQPPSPMRREQQLYELIRDHSDQRRSHMKWSDNLAYVAFLKCAHQATEGWDGHVSPYRVWPNRYLRDNGFRLPDSYDDDGNNVESLAHWGDGTPEPVFDSWLNSPSHRAHVLGEHSTFTAQTVCGIGYYYKADSQKLHYWCFFAIPEVGG